MAVHTAFPTGVSEVVVFEDSTDSQVGNVVANNRVLTVGIFATNDGSDGHLCWRTSGHDNETGTVLPESTYRYKDTAWAAALRFAARYAAAEEAQS